MSCYFAERANVSHRIICDENLYLLTNKNSVHLALVKILIGKKHTVGTAHLLAIK